MKQRPLIQSSETVYRGYFDLRTDILMRPDGKMMDYTSMFLARDATIIVPQTAQHLLVLSREYRHPTGQVILGFPGGSLEEGEDPLTAAKRELFEETGYIATDFTPLGSCYPLPSLLNQKIHFFLAHNASFQGNNEPDPFEFIETALYTEEELNQAIRSGTLIDGLLCTALWYKSLAVC